MLSFEVEGTLDGPFGPWRARGDSGVVVLRRAQGAVRLTGSAWIADAFARIEVEGRSYDVEPWVPGVNLHRVSLDDGGRVQVLAQVARGLLALHRAGVGHGGVGGGTVRIQSDGTLRLVGARRGAPTEDDDALEELAQLLWDEIPPDVAPRLSGAGAIEAWARHPIDGSLQGVEEMDVEIAPHELTGQVVSLRATPAAGAERPPKVQVAMVAGLTLVLGLLAGALLGGCGGPEEITLHVPGAIQVAAYCGGEQTHRTEGPNVDTLVFRPEAPAGTVCEVEAPWSPVMPLRGQLTLSGAAAYRCDRDGVGLACTPQPGR